MSVRTTVIRSFLEIPGPPLLPWIGSSYEYFLGMYQRPKYHLALDAMYQKYGPICREKIGQKEIIHLFSPDDFQKIYSQEGKYPHVYPLQISSLTIEPERLIAKGLGYRLEEDWWKLRKNGQPAYLKPSQVKEHLPSVNKVAQGLANRISLHKNRLGEIENLNKEMGIWSFENTMKIGCGRYMNAFEEGTDGRKLAEELVNVNEIVFHESGMLKLSLPIYQYLWTPKSLYLRKKEVEFIRLAYSFVETALKDLKYMTENNSVREKEFLFLRFLLGKSDLSLENVIALMIILLTDGLSTTVPVILFNLYSLAKNPSSQEKLYEEIQRVVKNDSDITTAHLKEMHYLKAFIKETFRLFPNGTEVSRVTDHDLILSGYEVPKGTLVDLNPGPANKSEEIYEDPLIHKPERWLRGKIPLESHPYQLLPFSKGTRMCVGRRLAEQDMNVVMITLLRQFRFEYPAEESVGQNYRNLLFPDRTMRVRFIPRE
ncbi:CYP49A [Lepeophtheirus salmonis]|uniref:CYP49A n=1 Tax=Lepeophtheirus salmonis TaxID=72036 RepID=A0A7R8CT50_LEPSM|nr:CYP49A [Lepeophtheirus salmonis]CAF2887202.1 CYP49A [Lepeophtheirus salmonis]